MIRVTNLQTKLEHFFKTYESLKSFVKSNFKDFDIDRLPDSADLCKFDCVLIGFLSFEHIKAV